MIIPLPSSSSVAVWTSIETTAGSSLSTSFGTLMPPSMAAPGDALPSLMVAIVVELPLLSVNAVTPTPTPAPIRADPTATRNQPLPRRFSGGPVGPSGGLGGVGLWYSPVEENMSLGGLAQGLGCSSAIAVSRPSTASPGQVGAIDGLSEGV